VKQVVRKLGIQCAMASLRAAIRSQGLNELTDRLRQIVPDVSDQYSMASASSGMEAMWDVSMRGVHAFQVHETLEALRSIGRPSLVVADIGDSSGNHGKYLKALGGSLIEKFVSVNLDPIAVEKVRSKGGEAVLCRAENIASTGISPDVFISFEMLEHLISPIEFLHLIATKTEAEYFICSIPYVRRSRFGGRELRCPEQAMPSKLVAESLHLFELNPEDWGRLFRFCGFKVERTAIYTQYPRAGLWRVMQPLWKQLDFEGFALFFLKRDLSVANRYQDWP